MGLALRAPPVATLWVAETDIECLHQQLIWHAMMGALPLELFESLPCFIKRLSLHLREGGDIIPEFGSLLRREILAQERFGETIASSERNGIRVQKPRLGLVL